MKWFIFSTDSFITSLKYFFIKTQYLNLSGEEYMKEIEILLGINGLLAVNPRSLVGVPVLQKYSFKKLISLPYPYVLRKEKDQR